MSLRRTLLIALLGFVILAAIGMARPAAAQITVTAPTATPSLGKVIATSGTSTFRIATDGTVTRTSGTAVRLSNAAVSAPTVTLDCGLLNLASLCVLRRVRVTVVPVANSGPAKITELRMGNLSGVTLYGAAPTPGATLTFDLNAMGILPITFKLGMDVAVQSGSVTGDQTFAYTVNADFLP